MVVSYNIYLNEPLPECEAEIQNEAKKRNMITTKNNCVVSVLVGGANNQTYFKKVHELSDLDNPNVIKRNHNMKTTANVNATLNCRTAVTAFYFDVMVDQYN